MDNNNDIIRSEENGVEFFTVRATGESAVSERGLAKMSGIPRKTIAGWLTILGENKAPKGLESLLGKALYLGESIKKNGKLIKAIRSEIAWRIIREGEKRGYTEASQVIDACGDIGLNSYIQAKTNWLPESYQSNKEARSILDFIVLNTPEKRDIHFDKAWRQEATRVTGQSWDGMPMANFLRKAVYDFLPAPIVGKLTEVNPYLENRKRRSNKHYQHLETNFDETILKQHIRDVYGVLRTSTNQHNFWTNMRARFGDGIQCDLGI